MIMTFRYFFKTKSFFEKLNKDYASKIEAVFGTRMHQQPKTNNELLVSSHNNLTILVQRLHEVGRGQLGIPATREAEIKVEII